MHLQVYKQSQLHIRSGYVGVSCLVVSGEDRKRLAQRLNDPKKVKVCSVRTLSKSTSTLHEQGRLQSANVCTLSKKQLHSLFVKQARRWK